MIKRISVVFLCLLFWLNIKSPALASTPIAEASASLKFPDNSIVKKDRRIKKLAQLLVKYNSPLITYADDIVTLADKYQIDYRLVVAISGVESTFCKATRYSSYNCWGWKNGKYAFRSFPDALEKVSKTLSLHYYNRGLDTPETIGPIYAPPSPDWAWKVRLFMSLIEDETTTTFLAKQFSI